jgi:hypothetical protein
MLGWRLVRVLLANQEASASALLGDTGRAQRALRNAEDAALGREVPSQEVTIRSVNLVSQTPEQLWTWQPVTEVPFGTALP